MPITLSASGTADNVSDMTPLTGRDDQDLWRNLIGKDTKARYLGATRGTRLVADKPAPDPAAVSLRSIPVLCLGLDSTRKIGPGFSVAAHRASGVPLVDKSLAVGDQAFHERCYDWIQAPQYNGVAPVWVTRCSEKAAPCCTQYVRLGHGRVVGTVVTKGSAVTKATTVHR